MLKYKMAFWSITAPAMIPFAMLVILAIVNPFWFRNDFINWTEKFARRVAEWRDGIGYVKYYYDKAHLFDTLKA
jgi:hypothetical protein